MRHARHLLALLVAAALLGLAACGGEEDEAAGSAATSSAGRTFTNPVHSDNFPDPFVLRADKTYYAYASDTPDTNVQTLTSKDLVDWKSGPDALPELGRWALEGKTWAPEVLAADGGGYILYYTANSADLGAQCIGRAVSRSPAGPFTDDSAKPLVCQKKEGGSIDASPFRDADGTLYLLWKNDGNCCDLDTYLYVQRLAPDGLELVGERVRLVRQDVAWEGSLVEAPTLWREGDELFLFFSANDYGSEYYAVGYATCETPLGPCRDAAENPILTTGCEAAGPGHQALVRDNDGDTWMVYHAWPPYAVGERLPGRFLWIDRVEWRGGKPDVLGPTCKPQAVP